MCNFLPAAWLRNQEIPEEVTFNGTANLYDWWEEYMDRRTFFRNSVGVSALAGSYLAFAGPRNLLAGAAPRILAGPVDLVAIRGGEAAQMFQKGIA